MSRRTGAKARQAAAEQAAQAADALLAWLHTQPRTAGPAPAGSHRPTVAPPAEPPEADAGADADAAGAEPAPDAPAPALAADPPTAEAIAPAPRRTAAPDPGRGDRHAPQRLAHTDWLHHRLRITGPEADLAAFRAAAAGAGTIPWRLDLDRMEEDLFHLLVAPPAPAGALTPPPRSLSFSGARILAGQLRAAAARRQELAVARVGQDRACPFDLHALVPVPEAVLWCGPDDPRALAWLWQHWGTTLALRHVAADADVGETERGRPHTGEAVFTVTFRSADWTPWRALAQIAERWPALGFETRPSYDAA